jgi:hypothetical protein
VGAGTKALLILPSESHGFFLPSALVPSFGMFVATIRSFGHTVWSKAYGFLREVASKTLALWVLSIQSSPRRILCAV